MTEPPTLTDETDNDDAAVRCGCNGNPYSGMYRPPRRYPGGSGIWWDTIPLPMPLPAPFPSNGGWAWGGIPVQHMGRPSSNMPMSKQIDELLPAAIPDYTVRSSTNAAAATSTALAAAASLTGAAASAIPAAMNAARPAPAAPAATPKSCSLVLPVTSTSLCAAVGGSMVADASGATQGCRVTSSQCV
jgi:hypothetical protein